MIGKKHLLLVDTRSFSEYGISHIPTAVNIDLMQFHWIDTSDKGIKEFNRQSRHLLSIIGVSKKKQVVFYDNISGSTAARGVWMLMYFSHHRVAMLDGGISSWKSAGFKTEKKTNEFQRSNYAPTPDPSILASVKDVESAIRSGSSVLIDSRSAKEFSGQVARAARSGHIPGAINIDWRKNISGSTFKEPSLLKKLYSQIPKYSGVITYCHGGYRAANTFVILHELGFQNVKMYLGSWGEWGNDLALPVTIE